MEVFKVPHTPFLPDFIGCVLLHIWIEESYENNNCCWPEWAFPWVGSVLYSLNKKSSNWNQMNTWNAYQPIDCTGSCDLLRYIIEEGVPHNLHDGNNLPWWNCQQIQLMSKILEKSWYESSVPNFNVNAHRKIRVTEVTTRVTNLNICIYSDWGRSHSDWSCLGFWSLRTRVWILTFGQWNWEQWCGLVADPVL